MATKSELYAMLERYEADTNGFESCDLLCDICDALPGQPEGEFSVEQIRQMIEESDLDD